MPLHPARGQRPLCLPGPSEGSGRPTSGRASPCHFLPHHQERRGTDKVKWAATTPGVHAVSLAWLEACRDQWRRVAEEDFGVREKPAMSKLPSANSLAQLGQLAPPKLAS